MLKKLLLTLFLICSLTIPAFAVDTMTQSQLLTDGEFALGVSETRMAQGFKVSTTDVITSITWQLKKQAASDGTITCYIYSDSSGNPNASVATFSNMLVSDLTTSFGDYNFTGTYTPVAGTQYHMVIIRSGATTGNWYGASYSINAYADGVSKYWDGSVWSNYSADFYFKLYQDVTARRRMFTFD